MYLLATTVSNTALQLFLVYTYIFLHAHLDNASGDSPRKGIESKLVLLLVSYNYIISIIISRCA